MTLNIRQVSKSYGSKAVLDEMSASFQPGHVYGVVGVNGAGKSTFFRCIAQMESYLGDISFGQTTLKHVVGFLPTHPVYMPLLTGREYLRFCAIARRVDYTDFNTINIFDLPLDEYASTYSTGMKKKLALTGLLLQKNEIYLLDEPYNGVDLQSNMMIHEIIGELKRKGKIILIASHIFSTLRQYCDEIFHLSEGRLKSYQGDNQYAELEDKIKGHENQKIVDRLGFL